MLQAANVSFRYRPDGPPAVDDVTLAIERGDLVAILGPNGSGKTTLLRLLSGTRVPVRGTVRLDGTIMQTITRREIARRIAMVPQEIELAFERQAASKAARFDDDEDNDDDELELDEADDNAT